MEDLEEITEKETSVFRRVVNHLGNNPDVYGFALCTASGCGMGAWFGYQHGGVAGAIAGGFVGCYFGGLIGLLAD